MDSELLTIYGVLSNGPYEGIKSPLFADKKLASDFLNREFPYAKEYSLFIIMVLPSLLAKYGNTIKYKGVQVIL